MPQKGILDPVCMCMTMCLCAVSGRGIIILSNLMRLGVDLQGSYSLRSIVRPPPQASGGSSSRVQLLAAVGE